ncbi:uncharacterized protein LOC123003923 [Tribolium madens]|uniref:uncharacterized protein LOC123003923 n=1 Tax=Tribolium madens TaxID=41895 RepID=UPI001CF72123|nr:uncharacterized protein LOC123003923 [Tribolium madens]
MSACKPIILTFLLFIFFKTNFALICKQCNMDCDDPLDELCLDPGEVQQVACLTEMFKDTRNRTFFQRKCVLYEKNTKYECPDYPQYTTISCVTCKTDRCNSNNNNTVTFGGSGGKIRVNISYDNSTY